LPPSRSPSQTFINLQCSYSSRLSRYWCALDHNEDEHRTLHTAFLCVTNMAGNATSTLLHFTPLNILKPDPPSDVKITALEGHETWIKVTWYSPTSWKHQDRYYELIYEVKYWPLQSSFYHKQVMLIKGSRSHTIKDAMPGVQYLIQLRAKDEYDGEWSDWSIPINASSWTAPVLIDDLITTTFPVIIEEGSTTDYTPDDVLGPGNAPSPGPVELSHALWISGSFVLLSVILAAYIFRHKDRLMSKLHRVSVIIQPLDSSELPPTTPAAPEEQALVTFTRPHYKEPPVNEGEEEDGENEEEQRVKERIEAMHFNNTSYFFVQRD
ncbi:interleukin-6 receptor subunit alpha-like, partial [Seriola lalandi dorsalis]|uniref:interleukin-6 receptor subunit alpha-like n=1 Tax=Seriola lalandi dorsalis TaxID=1841481 RepID=UPI000C6F7F00